MYLLVNSDIQRIELQTVGQSCNRQWFTERRKRLTASNFGAVINRRQNVHPTSLLKRLFSDSKFSSAACDWGSQNEKNALNKYCEKLGLESNLIENTSLIINPKWPWLGASPDGIVGGEIVKAVEVKCSYSKRDLTITDASCDKQFFLHIIDSKPTLKKRHVYYIQCQGIMAITEIDSIDFIVYTSKDIHVENIAFERFKWESEFLPKLTKFYFDFMKDEIIKL